MIDLKKQKELQYANFLVDWLNNSLSLDYRAFPNEEESSEIDIFATSASWKIKLNFQMVTSNGKTLKLAVQTKERIKKGLDIEVIDVDLVGWVSSIIEDKDRKYPKREKENLVLVIEGFIPTPTPEEVEKSFKQYKRSDFRGIYYVSLPVISSTNQDYERNGYVVVIKEIKM